MCQYNKTIASSILITIATSFFSYVNAAMIAYERSDIETRVENKNLKDVELCAQNGSAECATLMGGAYYWGLSFHDKKAEINDNIASNYLTKSLIESLTSRSILAIVIERKRGLESKALLTSAAKEGYYPAIYKLAHPDSFKTDIEKLESIKWRKIQIKIAPDTSGDEKGFIGSIYLKMTQPDYSSALPWLHKASEEEDDMLAQHYIARLYAEGKGVEQDYVTAYMYYDLSGSAGSEEKAKLTKYMTPAQVQEGIYRSHQWQDEHHSYRPGYGAWNDMGGTEWNVH